MLKVNKIIERLPTPNHDFPTNISRGNKSLYLTVVFLIIENKELKRIVNLKFRKEIDIYIVVYFSLEHNLYLKTLCGSV